MKAVALAAALSLALPALGHAATGWSEAGSKAVILVADRLAFEDFVDYPQAAAELEQAIRLGASAMMNVRTLGGNDSSSGYLSLAAGTRAQGGRLSGRAFHRDERVGGLSAAAVYAAVTGGEPVGDVLHLGIGEIRRLEREQGAALLRLGEALRAAGKAAAVLGNADVPGAPRRLAPLLVMSEDGIVPFGELAGAVVAPDPASPAGWRTEPAAAVREVTRFLARADVVVVEFGDLARLEEVERELTPERAAALRGEALSRLGTLTSGLLAALEELKRQGLPAWHLYLLVPSPSVASGRTGVLLTPVAWWSAAGRRDALLTSASTRRPGIVTNADFLAAILSHLGLAPGGPRGTGLPWEPVGGPDAFSTLLSQYRTIKAVHLLRLPVIQPYFFAVLALIAAGAALALLVHHGALRWPQRWGAFWRHLLAAVLTFPAALLLLPLFPGTPDPPSPAAAWGRILLWMALLTALSVLAGRGSNLGPAGVVALITALLVAVDTAAGSPLMQRSLLGYDPVAGSRYYGIGNEYMGVFLGSIAVASAYLLEELSGRRGAALPAAAFLAAAVLMGHPGLGINVGGAISAAVAVWASGRFCRGRPLGLGGALLCLAAAVAALGLSGILDALLSGERPSHLGQVVERVSSEGADPLWALFERKLAVNVKLIRLTVWSRVALASFAVLGITLFHPNWLARALRRTHPWLFCMARTAVVAAAAALLFNDSGVVAASTLSLWPVMALLSRSPDLAAEGTLDSAGGR